MASFLRKKSPKLKAPAVYDITAAPAALSRDQAGRQRRYFIAMMIRTVCFILTVALPSPYRWFALLGAVTLPYVAVVVANAGRESFAPGEGLLSDKAKSIEYPQPTRIHLWHLFHSRNAKFGQFLKV